MKLLIFLMTALYAKNTVETFMRNHRLWIIFNTFRTYECMLGMFYTFGNVCKQFFAFIPSSLHFTVDSEEEEDLRLSDVENVDQHLENHDDNQGPKLSVG